ncbi:uncharacterized protein FIBRA_02647 [Fibroporia radiculosa]|uniref:Uncharacterized protein n=1 Tax=Fibroporia radiculosa TaxID=599839 RepID=J4I963_9APHY|nr:uncharacterized protein FIBRA_02647 [Fibroporia radiculosa]CCM00611.1 predicted protein [Fibroporia radiculosa]
MGKEVSRALFREMELSIFCLSPVSIVGVRSEQAPHRSLLALNGANLITVQSQLFNNAVIPAQALGSVLTSRFFLNLRNVYFSDSDTQDNCISKYSATYASKTSRFSSVRFSHRIAGNFGAPLDDILTGDYFEEENDNSSIHDSVTYISENPLAAGLFVEQTEDREMAPETLALRDVGGCTPESPGSEEAEIAAPVSPTYSQSI